MAYSFTSVGKFFVYVRGAPLLYEKSNNAKCGVTRVRHSLNNVCILFDSRPHTLVEEGLENHLHMEKVRMSVFMVLMYMS
jgi:hypothetical protein